MSSNKSATPALPQDERRWHEFVSLCHLSNIPISPSDLQAALVEDQWPAPIAERMTSEFAHYRALLKEYDLVRSENPS